MYTNIVVWEFNGLNLWPADTNYIQSYGFIQYDIHINPDLPIGTKIQNRASASINYYEPIESNMVINTIVKTNSSYAPESADLSVYIYPNPNKGQFNLSLTTVDDKPTI